MFNIQPQKAYRRNIEGWLQKSAFPWQMTNSELIGQDKFKSPNDHEIGNLETLTSVLMFRYILKTDEFKSAPFSKIEILCDF